MQPLTVTALLHATNGGFGSQSLVYTTLAGLQTYEPIVAWLGLQPRLTVPGFGGVTKCGALVNRQKYVCLQTLVLQMLAAV